ncbi:hypothetical protein ACIBBE_11520 [Streptomyces sp. NPDC051644]|uniref:hypothetical protein n=1 Tax=Streptomyces sp. NPDC051644 TaxID=3365666 RepID=UPI0037ADD24D
MTMISAIITSEGIAAIADGRSVDSKTFKYSSDSEVKIVEMSPLCALMMCGYMKDHFTEDLESLASIFRQRGVMNVSRITEMLSNMFKDSAANTEAELLHNPDWPIIFILAGYDFDYRSKSYIPYVFYIKKPDWEMLIPKPNPLFGQAGDGFQETKEFLEKRYRERMSLPKANKLALKAMKKAIQAHPDTIGGDVRLWNIVPGKPILKFPVTRI